MTRIQGLPEPEGRQILAVDEAGDAFVVQLEEQRVYAVDETGRARLHSELVSDEPIRGAFRAAVGDGGDIWVFGFAPHFVRVFEDGEEREIERPGAEVSGMTVTGGAPTLALAPVVPIIGSDVGKSSPIPEIPPLVVQLEDDGSWRTWIERDKMDLENRPSIGTRGYETRLAGDEAGRLLMARHFRYDVREYQRDGDLAGRVVEGAYAMEPMPDGIVEQLEKAGRRVGPNQKRPKSAVEAVAWSPEAEVLILARAEGGFVLDRWVPALQERSRLPLADLDLPARPQMVASRNGLLFLPAARGARLTFVPWEYLRQAEWRSLDEEPAEKTAAASS